METLFSTVAQISFTLVGLFYLALTVDAKSKEFWFGERLHSRYAYLNLLFLLMPGFVALSALIPSPWESFPIWPLTNLLLVAFYCFFVRDLARLKKELNFNKISHYEERLDSVTSARTNILLIFSASVVGIFAFLVFPQVVPYANSFLGFILFLIVMVGIVPINIFISVNTQNRLAKNGGKTRSRREKTVKKIRNKR